MVYMLLGLLCVSLTALPPVRRRCYWLFYRVRASAPPTLLSPPYAPLHLLTLTHSHPHPPSHP